MHLKISLLATLLILFWAGIFFCLRGRVSTDGRQDNYSRWIQTSLADMFYTFSETMIFRTVMAVTLIFAILGFFAPGKISQIDKKLTIAQAISLNREGDHTQAALILEEVSDIHSPLVYNELGVAYLGTRYFEKAEFNLKKAIKALPHYGKAHQNLSVLYTLTDRTTEAAFEETRAREADNFQIPEHRLYNLPDSFNDQLGVRIFLAALLGAGAYSLPRLIIVLLRHRRQNKFDDQLADGLVMISNGLRAGLSLVQSLEMVVKEAKPPLSQEFDMVLREHRLGASLGDSLSHLADRMPGTDTRLMVNATLLLLESGGNLPEQFDTLAKTIQDRKRLQLKIKTMTAEGETQAWILAILPLALGLILHAMNKEVYSLMYTTPLGWMILFLIFLMEAVGLFLMLKTVKVKI
jgi:tight adherence protein B